MPLGRSCLTSSAWRSSSSRVRQMHWLYHNPWRHAYQSRHYRHHLALHGLVWLCQETLFGSLFHTSSRGDTEYCCWQPDWRCVCMIRSEAAVGEMSGRHHCWSQQCSSRFRLGGNLSCMVVLYPWKETFLGKPHECFTSHWSFCNEIVCRDSMETIQVKNIIIRMGSSTEFATSSPL